MQTTMRILEGPLRLKESLEAKQETKDFEISHAELAKKLSKQLEELQVENAHISCLIEQEECRGRESNAAFAIEEKNWNALTKETLSSSKYRELQAIIEKIKSSGRSP